MSLPPSSEQDGGEHLPGQEQAPRGVQTLLELCVRDLKRLYLGKVETLQLLDLANELDLRDLREETLGAIRFSYDFFRDAAGEDLLRELCGEREVAGMETARTERERSRRYLRQQGTVLEPVATEYTTRSTGEEETLACYPYEALIAGVQWPKGVDPARREDWLSDQDFEKHLKMTREAFKALPFFKRQARKKDARLW